MPALIFDVCCVGNQKGAEQYVKTDQQAIRNKKKNVSRFHVVSGKSHMPSLF